MMDARPRADHYIPVSAAPNQRTGRNGEEYALTQATITATYRHARPGELPEGRVVDMRPGPEPHSIHVIAKPGEATERLLDDITRRQASQMESGRWRQLPDTPQNRAHPRRILTATWELIPPERMPDGALSMSVELPGRHLLKIREGEATPLLVTEMTRLLTRFVSDEIWILRGDEEIE